jgi:glycosyltransferase involved in cell wall biosynthesis
MLDGFDADEWADAVMKYIDNPEYTQTVKDNAQKLIRDEYNWEVLAKKFLSAIEE